MLTENTAIEVRSVDNEQGKQTSAQIDNQTHGEDGEKPKFLKS